MTCPGNVNPEGFRLVAASDLPSKAHTSSREEFRGPEMADVKRPLSPEANGGNELALKKQRTDDGAVVPSAAAPAKTKEVSLLRIKKLHLSSTGYSEDEHLAFPLRNLRLKSHTSEKPLPNSLEHFNNKGQCPFRDALPI